MKNMKKEKNTTRSPYSRNITHRKISYKFIVYNELEEIHYKNHNKNEFEYYMKKLWMQGVQKWLQKLLKLA